jgi:hypothetical protein
MVEAVLPSRQGETAFILRSDTRPQRLILDPEVDLFRRLDPAEIPATINGLRGSESLVVLAARNLPARILEASSVLLEALGQRDAPIFQERDASASWIKDHDVLYLGMPEEEGYFPPLPPGVSLSPNHFTVAGKTYDATTDVLFVVLPHPHGGRRVAALFLPLSAGAAAVAARKISHYGKYSYLVFREGVNQAKGTWPIRTSPTIHHFTSKEDYP